MQKAIFLDRDGILNEPIIKHGRPFSPSSLSEVKIILDVKESLSKFKECGFLPVVITNQPDVSRGKVRLQEVEQINSFLSKKLGIENFYSCFHDDVDDCECRKPKPGLLFMAARDLALNLENSLLVGDRWKDIEAGQRAGCFCYFVDYAYREKAPRKPYKRVSSLSEVFDIHLSHERPHL